MRSKNKLLATLLIVTITVVLLPAVISSAATRSSSLAQGFRADSSQGALVSGTLVGLKPKSDDTAILASSLNGANLLGVVDANALVTISHGPQQVEVVLNGTTRALVSDINGKVKAGDKITVSSILGVGMKATRSGQIIGVATSAASGGKQQSIQDTHGAKHTVTITRVSVQVNVGHYDVPNNSAVPAFLRSIANTVAGRDVDVVRVLFAMSVLIVGFACVITIVFTAVRSTILSIGRNPMAATSIRLGLLEVLLIALLVTVATIAISYLILRI